MKTWFEPAQPVAQGVVNVRETISYLEIREQVPNVAGAYFSYLFRYTDTSALIAAYLNKDAFFVTLEQQLRDPKMGGVWNKSYREAWPMVFSMIDNTIAGRISNGALLRLQDPDNYDYRWMIGSIVGNIDFNNSSEANKLLFDKRVTEAYQLAFRICATINHEFLTRQPSKLKLFFRGAVAGGLEGQKLANNLEKTWMPVMKSLFGA
jgi:hypothetical protein